ncbi:MAG TPA: hypothetical protein VG826_31315 [Pirellulales bacterium]|nr:hypothetical protein [Pirellulales bacterium]
MSAIDAVFTATSACYVTGLAVRSTGGELSAFGQAVVLALVQVGGIGIMTITTLDTPRVRRIAESSLRTVSVAHANPKAEIKSERQFTHRLRPKK